MALSTCGTVREARAEETKKEMGVNCQMHFSKQTIMIIAYG